MHVRLSLLSFAFAVAAVPVFAQGSCPWAAGEYAFRDHGIYGDFRVNAECTSMEWDRISDSTEVTDLKRTSQGWAGSVEGADFVLLEDGIFMSVQDPGSPKYRSRPDRKN